MVFNKIDAYRYEEYDEFSLEPKRQENYTLEEFKNSWIAKENTPCIFISAREKMGIDKLRGDLYKMVAEIHFSVCSRVFIRRSPALWAEIA